jgi:hypothetical protein
MGRSKESAARSAVVGIPVSTSVAAGIARALSSRIARRRAEKETAPSDTGRPDTQSTAPKPTGREKPEP